MKTVKPTYEELEARCAEAEEALATARAEGRASHGAAEPGEAQVHLQGIFESNPVGMALVDADSRRFVQVNHAFEDITGQSGEGLSALTTEDIAHPDDRQRWTEELAARRHAAAGSSVEVRFVRRDGAIRWVEASSSLLGAGARAPLLLVTALDVTDRKEFKQRLIEQERYLQTLLQTTVDGFWVVDSEGRFTDVNDTYCAASGYTREEFLQLRIPDIDARESSQMTAAHMEKIFREGSDVFETVHRRKDGTLHEVEVSSTYIPSGNGRLVCFCRDVSERRRAERALRESERRYRDLFEMAPVGVFSTTLDGRTISCNTRLARLLGFETAEEAVAKHIDLAASLYANPQQRVGFIRHIRDHGSIEGFELEVHVTDGSTAWLNVSARLAEHEGFDEPIIEGFATDVTERKHAADALRESEALLDAIIEAMPAPVFYMDPDGIYLGCNKAFCDMVGFSETEIVGHTVFDTTPRELAEQLQEANERLIASGGLQAYETATRSRDGVAHQVMVHKALFHGPDGSVRGIVGAMLDITHRKHAEEALKAALAQAQKAETETQSLLNASRASLETHSFLEASRRIFDAAREATGATSGYIALMSEDGSENEVLFLEAGGLPCSVDPNLPMPIRGLRAEAYASKQVVVENDFMNSPWVEFMPPGHVEMRNVLFAPLTIGGSVVGVMGLANKDGDFSNDDARISGAFGDLAAIALRRTRAEDDLRESKQQLELALQAAGMGAWDYEIATGRLTWGAEHAALFGVDEERSGGTLEDLRRRLHPEDGEAEIEALQQAAREGTGHDRVYRIVRPDGTVRWMHSFGRVVSDDSGQPVRIVGATRDITEMRRVRDERAEIEAREWQLQKSESLGRMAAAIAHNFNNQLSVVLGNLELTALSVPDSGPAAKSVSAAIHAARRASEVSGQMLTYLGHSRSRPRPLHAADACRQAAPVLLVAAPQGIDLTMDLPSPGPVVRANRSQLQQVLTNLVTNAWESMAEEEGVIRVTMTEVDASSIPAAHRYPLDWKPRAQTYARLAVTDTGNGIDGHDVERIFDPFFSTKFIGRGMGLPAVLGILRSHDAAIVVESEVGKGSTFSAFLPITDEPVAAEDVIPESAGRTAGAGRGPDADPASRGTVLLIEDQEGVRDVMRAGLECLGWRVVATSDGPQGIAALREHGKEIRCVLCDMVMPHMSGWETLSSIRTISHSLPVIFTSGYDEEMAMSGEHAEQPDGFLHKPSSLDEMAAALAKAVAAEQGEQ